MSAHELSVRKNRTIEKHLAALHPSASTFFDLHYCCETESTNKDIKEAILHGAPEGTLTIAVQQKSAYGRQGRSWESPLGGLYFSCVFRPLDHGKRLDEVATLTLAVSLAVRRVIESYNLTLPILVKWPNDIVCDEGKMCGISAEVIRGAVCLGVGVNLFQPEKKERNTGTYQPVYITMLLKDSLLPSVVSCETLTDSQVLFMDMFIARLLQEVFSVYNHWLVNGFSLFHDEYCSHSFLQGKTVRIVSLTQDVVYEGVVCGVDVEGRLCVKQKAGDLIRVHSGEVHLL